MTPTAPDDAQLARRLATEAGTLLRAVRAEVGFADRHALRAAGDRRAQEFLAAGLARARPGDAVLSEEAPDDRSRLSAERVWIIDPLDGTWEFGEPGRTDWAVHVALWERGTLTAGAVALPDRDLTLSTAEPPPPPLPYGGPPRVVASRRRAPAFVDEIVGALGGMLVPLGSAGAKIAVVVLGEADVYLHAGGQREWDSAAPVAVAHATGLHASRLDGGPLTYNKPDPLVPDLLVCRADLAADVLALVAGLPRLPR